METVVIALAALACPVGMVVMGWFMAKGMRSPNKTEHVNVNDLRAEHRRLGSEIERLEQADSEGGKLPAAQG